LYFFNTLKYRILWIRKIPLSWVLKMSRHTLFLFF
jgi:hypothetical protein